MEKYIVIYRNDSGDVSINEYTKKELESMLNDNYWGNTEFISSIPKDSNPQYWSGERVAVIICGGEVVVPKAETKVTSWKL
jgi:hypothetical protein